MVSRTFTSLYSIIWWWKLWSMDDKNANLSRFTRSHGRRWCFLV